MFDRAEIIDTAFIQAIRNGAGPQPVQTGDHEAAQLAASTLIDLFDSQLMSRHLDLMARRSKGKTFYSIGSAGHEGMVALALATRPSDMAFLHYRDAAFLIQRMKQTDGETPLYNMALSFSASASDPVSGGRHKVLGGLRINVPPQTSTIASHLPKAVGAAHSIGIANKLKTVGHKLACDGVIIASFGDASVNHSTAQGAINAACWASYQGAPMPLVLVCEDNGIGISVPTPDGWIAANYSARPGLAYIPCDTRDLEASVTTMTKAVRYARVHRKPVFIHAKTIRLMGHAGADIEATYKSLDQIAATEADDPLLHTAQTILDRNILSKEDIVERYSAMAARVERVSALAMNTPKLTSSKSVMASLLPPKNTQQPVPIPTQAMRRSVLPSDAIASKKPLPLARTISFTLADILLRYPKAVCFGEDVGKKGGVYGVTGGLQKSFGKARVFDTLLDEQSILGQAIGMAQNGFIPIPEIQFLAYLHNAEDQVRGEAATLSFFSNGQFTNPMVIRIAGLGYQKGFGGHFHNDNSFAVLRDIPGVMIACPSNAADAPGMLRECFRLAHDENRVVIFLEPIALYGTQDLHETGDGAWMTPYGAPDKIIGYGKVATYRTGRQAVSDLSILTYANGYYLSRQAAKKLADNYGLQVSVTDLRWLHPLPEKSMLKACSNASNILIVDECRQTGSLSEQIMTSLGTNANTKPVERITAKDSFIPLGPAAYTVLPGVDDIVKKAVEMCCKSARRTTTKRKTVLNSIAKKKVRR